MKSTPFSKPSKTSKPSHRRLIWLLVGTLALCAGILVLPLIVRSSPTLIRSEIAKIQSLPIEKQATELIKLQRATGGDQAATRALADYYRGQGDYQAAATTYLTASPRLEVEAAQMQIETYDFRRTQLIIEQAQKRSSDPELKLLQIQIQLNTNKVDEGCRDLKDMLSSPNAHSRAQDLETACRLQEQGNLTVSQLYSLVALGAPMLTQRGIEDKTVKATSDYLVLAQIAQRQKNENKVLELVKRAYEITPFDREVLSSIILLYQSSSSKEARELFDRAKATERQLPQY